MQAARSRRLFVALLLGPEVGPRAQALVRGGLGLDLRERAPQGLRLLRALDLHLTLVFLGQVRETLASSLVAELGQALAGHRAPCLELRGGGAFPRREQARVLWVEPREFGPGNSLTSLHLAVRGVAGKLGLELDPRPFRPHVSVARLARTAESVPQSFFELDLGLDWQPRTVSLVESVAGGGEGRYRALAEFPLAPGGEDQENPQGTLRHGPSGR